MPVSLPMVEPLRPALALSVIVHVGVLGLAMVLTAERAASLGEDALGASQSGDTFDVDELLDGKRSETSPAAAAVEPSEATETVPVPVKRVPKKKRVPAPKPEAEHGASNASAPAASGGSASTESAGSPTPGTSGTDPSVANLSKAFAKAMTAAAHKDPIWDELPLGAAGTLHVAIHVDEEGRLEQSVVKEREQAPAHLLRLVDRTLVLLRAGRFALSQREAKAGTESLRIEVTLSSVDPQEDYEDPRHTVAMGFDPPRPGRPGHAWFVHAAGRRFEAKISLE